MIAKILAILLSSSAFAANQSADNFLAYQSVQIFDPASRSKSVKIQSPTLPSSWALTWPTTAGTANYCLATDGFGVTSWNSPTGGLTIGAFGSTPNANGLSYSDPTLNMQPADGTHPGGISLSAQTVGAGTKTWTGEGIWTVAGVSGIGSILVTGSAFTGGNSTTNKPIFLIEDAATSSTWSNNGTEFGINAKSGFTGDLMNLLSNNVHVYAFNALGGADFHNIGDNLYTGSLTLVGQGNNDFQKWSFYAGATNTLAIFNKNLNSSVFGMNYLGQMGFGAAAMNHPSAWFLFQARDDSYPTIAIKKNLSQTTDAFALYDTDEVTKLFNVDISGKAMATNLQDTALSTGCLHSDSSGNVTSSTCFSGTVTAVSVASANGFAGSSSGGATPALTISTSINSPIVAANGTALSAATTTGSGSTAVLATAPTLTNPIVGTQTAGDNSTKAASTAFVQAALAQLNPAAAVTAASTANITGTYTNAVGGVCIADTFQVTSTAAFVVDGITLAVGQRVLFKNQTSGFQNGVWTLTTAANVGVLGALLTRALDWDSSADMNAGNLIPVISGTTNASTVWFQTAAITTCSSDSQVYTQFSGGGGSSPVWASASGIVTPSAGFIGAGSITNQTYFKFVNGKSVHVRGSFTVGTVAGSTASAGISGYTIDSTVISSTTNSAILGTWCAFNSATTAAMTSNCGFVFYDGSSTSTIFFGYQIASGGFKKNTGTDIATSGQGFTFDFEIPVQ